MTIISKIKAMFKSWKTALPGVLLTGIGIASLLGYIDAPGAENEIAIGIVEILTGLGLIASRDANKTSEDSGAK